MVFDLFGTDRLAAWKTFRDSLENSDQPLEEVAEFWSQAPFVSPYLDPKNPKEWPDPWHLILDLRLDDLAIALGMYYTLKLTRRFMNSDYEIHMSIAENKKNKNYALIVDRMYILNWHYKQVVAADQLNNVETSIIWSDTCKK